MLPFGIVALAGYSRRAVNLANTGRLQAADLAVRQDLDKLARHIITEQSTTTMTELCYNITALCQDPVFRVMASYRHDHARPPPLLDGTPRAQYLADKLNHLAGLLRKETPNLPRLKFDVATILLSSNQRYLGITISTV
jgi:hypothetical protein